MKKLSAIIVVALGLVLAVGVAFLATWNIPAPTAPVQITIPDEKLPH